MDHVPKVTRASYAHGVPTAVAERATSAAPETPPAPPPATPTSARSYAKAVCTALTVLVVLGGIALRLVPALGSRGVIYPDETYQMTEAAHRVVFGYGITPWEFSLGTRSWLGPGLLMPPMLVWRWLELDGGDGTGLVRAWVAVLAGLGAASAALLGRRLAGVAGGLLAAAFVAFSPLGVVYEVHPLADSVAAPLTVTAVALLTVRRRPALAAAGAGVLLVAAVVLRPQLLPLALAVVAGVLLAALLGRGRGGTAGRRSRGLTLGLALGAAGAGLLDVLTWGAPFAPVWRSFTWNVVDDGASRFGESPWSTYLTSMTRADGLLFVLLLAAGLLLACRPRRDDPVVLAVVVAGLVSVLTVVARYGHKEVRFLEPALPLAGALAGVGLARALQSLLGATRRGAAVLRGGVAVTAMAATAASAGMLALPGVTMSDLGYTWSGESVWSADDATPRLLSEAGTLPGVCGVVVHSTRLTWAGGYSALHRDVPLAATRHVRTLHSWQEWANVVVTRAGTPLPEGYLPVRAADGVVVAQRPGGCGAPPEGVALRTL